MNKIVDFGRLKAGDKLLIVSNGGRTFDLTVRRTATPGMTFLIVVINSIQGGSHDFTLGEAAMLHSATWGDVTAAEAAQRFKGKSNCTSISEGCWVSLLQWHVPAGILRVKSLTLIKK